MEKLTLQSCFAAHEKEQLKEWAVDFLNTEGNNKKLARIIQETDCVSSLVEHPLEELRRIGGPEEDMLFRESNEVWEQRVASLRAAVANGYQPLPLIVTDFWEDSHISDGCHRHEALKRNGFRQYWVIFFKRNSSTRS